MPPDRFKEEGADTEPEPTVRHGSHNPGHSQTRATYGNDPDRARNEIPEPDNPHRA